MSTAYSDGLHRVIVTKGDVEIDEEQGEDHYPAVFTMHFSRTAWREIARGVERELIQEQEDAAHL